MSVQRLDPALPGRAARGRNAVVRLLAACPDFVSAQDLHDRAARASQSVSLTTVYRALGFLERAGMVDVIRDERGERLYRRRLDGEHRHYLVCRSCGRSLAVDSDLVERWAERVEADSGFSGVEHTVELTGVCRQCRLGGPIVGLMEPTQPRRQSDD